MHDGYVDVITAGISTAGTVLAALIAARQAQVKRALNGSKGELQKIHLALEQLLRSRRRD